jgi:hypothetical protein
VSDTRAVSAGGRPSWERSIPADGHERRRRLHRELRADARSDGADDDGDRRRNGRHLRVLGLPGAADHDHHAVDDEQHRCTDQDVPVLDHYDRHDDVVDGSRPDQLVEHDAHDGARDVEHHDDPRHGVR